ncbi:MAG: GNAT family N-acetyltransferase [Ferruginibacter sp.]
MEIQQKQNGSKGSFFIQEGDQTLAEMTYTMAGDSIMIIDHTEVSDALGGKGVGLKLVNKGVDYARANGLKIIPLCPFAKSVFDKKKEAFADVLKTA